MNANESWLSSPPRTDAEHLAAHWMPFSGNREFKAHPRLITAASGRYYTSHDGRRIFDGLSGLWCTGLGHGRREIIDAIAHQGATLDYAPAFQFGHPLSFELANRIVERMPAGLNRVFFTGSGSEAADTSLKMARAYWRLKGQPGKTRLIGRAKGYHGVNFGGISVGGIAANRKFFGQGVEADHLPHTQPAAGSFYRGMPPQGAELADELLALIQLHDASAIAAVIVEPFSGSAGVVVPPVGYLQRLRDICTAHDILLIFDEVITGFGRTGNWFGSQTLGIRPDIITIAKGLSSGYQPIGGSIMSDEVAEVLGSHGDFNHGYTYSGHPVAAAVALENLRIIEEEGMIEHVRNVAHPYLAKRWQALTDHPLVGEAKLVGLMGSIALTPDKAKRAKFASETGTVGYRCRERCFANNLIMRHVGDRMIISPPLVIKPEEIDVLIERARKSLDETHKALVADGMMVAG